MDDTAFMKLSPKYVLDNTGQRTEVILPLADYEKLLEDLEDLAAIADRRSESTISHDQFLAELREDGILPN
jgi:hypothetical protein